MKSHKPQTAETNFWEAFERLKAGAPKLLPVGSHVSQNNVAKEAGRDPSALRKFRFPSLVAEIKRFVSIPGDERPPSERQRLLKQRKQSRNAREIIADLKAQRDATASLLVDANAEIGILTRRVRDLEVRVEDLQPGASILRLQPPRPKGSLRGVDTPPAK